MINLRGFTLQTYWYQDFQNHTEFIKDKILELKEVILNIRMSTK